MRAKDAQDSIGGTITCVIRNVPTGLGEPVFDKFEATLAHAMLSIPATKAFEIGSGFRGTEVPGSKHNDPFILRPDGALGTATNWSGGVQGGITNGEDIYFRCVLVLLSSFHALIFLVLALNLPQQYLSLKRPPNMMVRLVALLPGADMTLVLCHELFLLWKQWQLL